MSELIKIVQMDPSHRGPAGKARATTRSQVRKGPKTSQRASTSWMEGEVYLDRKVSQEEQLKDPANVALSVDSKRGQDQIRRRSCPLAKIQSSYGGTLIAWLHKTA